MKIRVRATAVLILTVFLAARPFPARAQPATVLLTITLEGPQSGRVGIIPIGLLCDTPGSTPCTASFDVGTVVRIVANGAVGGGSPPGLLFEGTGDAGACGTSTCTFTITTASTVKVKFDNANGPFVTVTTNLAGDGQGRVGVDNSHVQNFDPLVSGANAASYVNGSVVSMGATPTPESRFAGYSDGIGEATACGLSPNCSYTLTANTSVTANFHALTAISVEPPTAAMLTGRDQLFSAKGTFTDGVTETISSIGMGVWRTRAQMPTARFGLAAAAANGKVYALGGIVGQVPSVSVGAPSSLVEAYDPVANTWVAATSMSIPREQLGAAAIGDFIYAVGGHTSGSIPVATMERYDSTLNTWTPRASLAAARSGLAAAALNGIVYAIGGNTGGGNAGTVATVEAYDPATNAWSPRAPMLTARQGMAVAVGDGGIYVSGGLDAGGGLAATTEVYDPVTDTWTAKAAMPNAVSAQAGASADGVVYVMGGPSSSVATYDTVRNQWGLKSGLPTARGEVAVTSLNGIVYAIGGLSGAGESLKTVEAFTDAVRWSSSNPAVATINQAGTAHGVTAGQADILATIGRVGGGFTCATTNACGKATVTLNVITMTLDRTALLFGATRAGIVFVNTTPPQQVRMTQSGAGTVTWTAVSNRPWLKVSPSSGTGSALFTVSVVSDPSIPASGTLTGAVSLTLSGADAPVGPINVSLAVQPAGTSVAPFGSLDTPLPGTTGVVGSLPVTGWALDDIGVARVRITRSAVTGEPAGSEIPLGIANIVEGARPDIAAGFPGAPRGTAAGYGYLLLTNFLPNQGNGTFTLSAFADDVDGHSTLLGSRTITCTNSSSQEPFGAIDTPGQGETVTGSVNNFGWVLSPGTRRADPPSGGIVNVFIDGLPVGAPFGWSARSDLTSLFPVSQYPGVVNAQGVFPFDSTVLTNGVHTIPWGVTDNQGGAAGVGSRYFTASNGSGLMADSGSFRLKAEATGGRDENSWLPASAGSVVGRRGYDLEAPLQAFAIHDGRATIQSEELDRIELHVGAGAHGYQLLGGTLQSLPIGSHLDPDTGTFTWQPGVAFLGSFDLVFAGPDGRRDVRVVLNAKRSGRVGPQVVIDVPLPPEGGNYRIPDLDPVASHIDPVVSAFRRNSIVVAGWAADLDSGVDTGVDTVHVWAYPTGGGDPIFVGAADYGGARPDVARTYGDRFEKTGYGITVQGLAPGTYDLAVFAYSTVRGGFVPAKVVRVTIR